MTDLENGAVLIDSKMDPSKPQTLRLKQRQQLLSYLHTRIGDCSRMTSEVDLSSASSRNVLIPNVSVEVTVS